MNPQKIFGIKGMNDILPDTSAQWEWLEECVRAVMARFVYCNIRTPVVESTHLFARGLGEVTDIVEKEMYSFEDKMNGDALTLRPENTAGVVRAVVEHNLLYEAGRRLYYMGPMFRHERPQRGRYRQFHQVGAEALGFAGFEVDAEVILLASAILQELALVPGQDYRLELGTLGRADERGAHRAALIAYFTQHMDMLDVDARRRLHTNPLRILDTKNPHMQSLVQGAPRLMDFLGTASRAHFDAVCEVLQTNGLTYVINPRLVRGMDYYNSTVFEFVTPHLGAQGTICGGGRYDGLIEQMGGKPAPAVGWGLGVERVLELLRTVQRIPATAAVHAYATVESVQAMPRVMQVLQQLRQSGVCIQMQTSQTQASQAQTSQTQSPPVVSPPDSRVRGIMPGFRSQFKRAHGSGAKYALVFGDRELADNAVGIKLLRAADGMPAEQKNYPLNEVLAIAALLRQ